MFCSLLAVAPSSAILTALLATCRYGADGCHIYGDNTMAHRGLTFGIFLAPFHRLGENPTLALDRDVELIQWLDHLGYDEAWIGEHHSAGWELIASRN